MSTHHEIQTMELDQLSMLLEEKGIEYEHLETIEEMRELLLKRHEESSSMSEDTRKNQEAMEDILANDRKMREELAEIYEMLAEFLKDKDNGKGVDCIKSIMKDMHGDFDATLTAYTDELLNDECPIVVAGETSAGKSSLLNLILGTDVLAHSLLGTTTTICRLHNSDTKRFEIVRDNDEIDKVAIDEKKEYTDEEWKNILKPYIASRDPQTHTKCKRVDVYWPIPMLQKHVTIVDTPGIGENDPLTDVLLSYLPKAVAFIYVINSANSGGIQDDYLLKILQKQSDWALEGRPTSIDYDSTIFVCNKWDKVEKEEQKVWKYTQEKIQTRLPNFPLEHIFKMSATEADRYRKSGLGLTSKFEKLLEAIEKLVAQSMKGKIRKHFRWIDEFLMSLQRKLLSRINHAKTKEEDKAKLKDEVLRRLGKLNMDADKVKDGLIKTARASCQDVSDKLFKHVQSDAVRDEILTWREDDIPDIEADDLEVTKYRAEQRIQSRIRDVLKSWEKKTLVFETMSEKLTKMFKTECQLLGKECQDINLLVEGHSEEWPDSLVNVRQDTGGNPVVFSKSEKVVLAVMAPLWVPLVTAASILFLPVGVGMFINESIKERKQRANFMKDKPKYMKEWAKKAIDIAFTEENIHKFVTEVYTNVFERQIELLCSDFIPKQIDADRQMINAIVDDMRSSSQILKEFQPLLRTLRAIIGKLRLYELDYLKLEKIPAIELKQYEQIGNGNFSTVYKAKWTISDNEETDVALKVLKGTLKGATLLGQLDEVECLRNLEHRNIVKLYGICYSTNEVNDDRRLTIVLELCEGCLENIVFNDERLHCRKYRLPKERAEAFAFYLKMAIGVCDGLAEMHKQRYLHRDLKLSNVLVKEQTAKLCDLGFAKGEALMTGTFAGTMTHMSPELLKAERYTFSSDIYSLSILLWELWYGRNVYNEDEYAMCTPYDLLEAIRTGTRPLFTHKYAPPNELKDLIIECWDSEPTKRPQASQVASKLREMEGGSDEHQ